MEQEQRKQISINFSEKYIMGKEERISRNGKQYEILWIMIPDGNDIDISSKQVFSVPSWLVGTDRELKDRRFIKLDQGRQISVYPANGLNENFSVDKEHCHLADPEELASSFREYDRKPYSSRNLAGNFQTERKKED